MVKSSTAEITYKKKGINQKALNAIKTSVSQATDKTKAEREHLLKDTTIC